MVGVAGARSQTQVLNSAQFFFCGMGVSFQPFPVRPNSKGWEWSENGKIGFDLVKEAISSMDFGRGIVFLK